MDPEQYQTLQQMAQDLRDIKSAMAILAVPVERQGALFILGLQLALCFLSIVFPLYIIRRASKAGGGEE